MAKLRELTEESTKAYQEVFSVMPKSIYGITSSFLAMNLDNTPYDKWHNCREIFHHRFYSVDSQSFLFTPLQYQDQDGTLKYKDTDKIMAVVTEAEDLLKLPEQHRLEYSKFKNQPFFIAYPSRWWRDLVRFNFLTILIKYCHNNLQNTMTNVDYLQKTKTASDHFLLGNTYYQGSIFNGWLDLKNPDAVSLLKNTPSSSPLVSAMHYHGGATQRITLNVED